ncbi:MAG: hypothetical protein GX565_05255 [Lentisphaerae bacterium]|nr:hypothetical protein [Lentisphaerota bacterium]
MSLRTFRRLFLNAAFLHVFFPAQAGVMRPPPNIDTWGNLDGMVAEAYAGLTHFAFIYPPRTVSEINDWFSRVELWGGWRTFSPECGLASITNCLQPTFHYGVPVWKMAVAETTDVSRVWLYTAMDGTSFRTNGAPSALDPRQWVRDVYKSGPPSYLSGTEVDEWYESRDRSRFAFGFTLISSNDWPLLAASIMSAATNNPPPGSPPLAAPEDTNRLAFAGAKASSNELSLSVYTPADGIPVDLLTRPALGPAATHLWLIRSTFTPSAPFGTWSGPYLGSMGFFLAARTDTDSDGDGISDCRETFVLGTRPDRWDSAGLAIGDFARLYVYGLAPLLRDTNGDGMDDDEAILRGLNPATQNAGVGVLEIRYVHDADDRLLGAFTTTAGGAGGGAAAYTLSPAHNALAAGERSAP